MTDLKELTKEEMEEITKNYEIPKLNKDIIKYPNEISRIFDSLPLDDVGKLELYREIMELYKKDPNSPELKF